MKASVLFSIVITVAVAFSAAAAESQTVKSPESHPGASDIQGQWRPVPCDSEKYPGKCGRHIWLSYDEALNIALEDMWNASASVYLIHKETFLRALSFRGEARQYLVTVHDSN